MGGGPTAPTPTNHPRLALTCVFSWDVSTPTPWPTTPPRTQSPPPTPREVPVADLSAFGKGEQQDKTEGKDEVDQQFMAHVEVLMAIPAEPVVNSVDTEVRGTSSPLPACAPSTPLDRVRAPSSPIQTRQMSVDWGIEHMMASMSGAMSLAEGLCSVSVNAEHPEVVDIHS